MNDVIYREDAIGAILSVGHIAELGDGDAVIRVSAVNYVLRNLPSAQPEQPKIIRCKDCKKFSYTNYISRPYGWCEAHEGTERDDGFCYRGEKNER